jgi:tetratricopeptide (TPR) repeat protein
MAKSSESDASPDFAVSGRKLEFCQGLIIVLVGIWITFPALQGLRIRDDNFYLDASLLNNPAHLWNTWFRPGSFIEYYPITETVQWLQWKLWGDHMSGYHLTNLVLHVVNAILVWRLFRKFELSLAWLGGLLFLVHPAQVESVAWISELKNTLSLTPFLLSMMAWVDFEEKREVRDYLLALGLFTVAMLCKITMVPFPVIILLYAWWKRGRIDWNDLKASAPFFLVSIILGGLNVWSGAAYAETQRLPSMGSADVLSKIAFTGTTLSFYFTKCFWPGQALPIYPRWQIWPLSFWEFLPWIVAVALFVLAWRQRRTWGRHVILGLGFFLLTLAPFLGLIIVSYMRITWVMDHFLYIPIIGLIGLVVAGLGEIQSRLPSARAVITGAATLVVTLMAFQSHAYSGAYADEVTLWDYALEYNPDDWASRAGLADALRQAGQYAKAIEQYEKVLALQPDDADMHNNMGVCLAESGQTPEAIDQFRQAVKINPKFVGAFNNLGYYLGRMGNYSQAESALETAVELNPNYLLARENLKFVQDQQKKGADKK